MGVVAVDVRKRRRHGFLEAKARLRREPCQGDFSARLSHERGVMIMRTIKIEGMSCNHCVAAVEKALNSIEGVTNVMVDLNQGEASFEEGKAIDMQAVRTAVEKAGYKVG